MVVIIKTRSKYSNAGCDKDDVMAYEVDFCTIRRDSRNGCPTDVDAYKNGEWIDWRNQKNVEIECVYVDGVEI